MARRIVRGSLLGIVVAGLALMLGPPAHAQTEPQFEAFRLFDAGKTPPAEASCKNAAQPTTGTNALAKTVKRTERKSGAIRFDIRLTTPATVTKLDVFDCTWVDLNNDGKRSGNEKMQTYTRSIPLKPSYGKRTGTFAVILTPNVGAGGLPVCDQVRAFAKTPGGTTTFVSPIVCDTPAPVISESRFPALLTASAIAMVAGVSGVFLVRRRLAARKG